MHIATAKTAIEEALRVADRLGLSQQKLASRLGMSQGHLSKVLSGKARLTTKSARRLATFIASANLRGSKSAVLAEQVREAASRDQNFRAMVMAALRMMQNMHS